MASRIAVRIHLAIEYREVKGGGIAPFAFVEQSALRRRNLNERARVMSVRIFGIEGEYNEGPWAVIVVPDDGVRELWCEVDMERSLGMGRKQTRME